MEDSSKNKQEETNPFKILVIEDEATLLYALQAKFSLEGFKVMAALDGKTGLDLALQTKPNLILLDLLLPIVDGFEVLKRLKENEETKEIPVIIISNLDDKEKIEEGLRMGAIDYLVKADYRLDEVIEKIRKIINK